MVTFRSHISLYVVLSSLCVCPASYALEMSSKRDCAICHIMWLNEFRTDEETLIEWQPGNVLMKDTQGVVSSEEICYSCHDGYVGDSRYTVWKYNSHGTYIKPSKKVKIPGVLTLSNKDEIYCGTCHSPHGAGAAPKGESGERTSFFREPNVDSGLCEMCHINEADFRRTGGHPLHTTANKIPSKLFGLGSKKAENRNSIICQTCHQAHGAKGSRITVVDNRKSRLCMLCHEQRSIEGTKHDMRLTLPNVKNIKQQPLSESGPCGACHIPHNSRNKRLWARGLEPGNAASQMCLACHGKSMGNDIKGTGTYSHPNNVKLVSKGTSPKGLPLFETGNPEDPDATIQCFTCHEVHRWDPGSPDRKGGKDKEGDASNSFLRISNSASSALCIECHLDKKQVTASDHNLQVTAPDEKNIQGFKAGASGPCGACHTPHNAAAKRLWAKKLSSDKPFVLQFCTGCHDKNGAAKEKQIGDNYHPVNVTYKKIDGSGGKDSETPLPLYNDGGTKLPEGKMVCITCHEPHNWGPSSTESVSRYSSMNMEGDATNSFLRKSNSPVPALCRMCHEDKAVVIGTDHDLIITAPMAKNLLGQTVKESGQCGACHLVHNSPNRLRLWARSYGPVSEDESFMSGLCTSCHSKGAPGENKIPPVASHPSGKLINNIMRFSKDRKDYTPIFDNNGEEVNVGDISCPSCHSFHEWSLRDRKEGVRQNIEGDAMNSFLRIPSYNTVCIDCHGADAILRYNYFHLSENRKKLKESDKNAPQH